MYTAEKTLGKYRSDQDSATGIYAAGRKSRDPMLIAAIVMAQAASSNPLVIAQRALAKSRSGAANIASEAVLKLNSVKEGKEQKEKQEKPLEERFGFKRDYETRNPFAQPNERSSYRQRFSPFKTNSGLRYDDYTRAYNRPRYERPDARVNAGNNPAKPAYLDSTVISLAHYFAQQSGEGASQTTASTNETLVGKLLKFSDYRTAPVPYRVRRAA